MAKYATSNAATASAATASTYKSLLAAYAITATPRRGKIYDVLIGTNGTPADNYIEWQMQRFTDTALFTGTAVVPAALDPADAASLSLSLASCSTDTTALTAAKQLFYIGVNQRASYRWVAAPGSELIWPATALNGIALMGKSASYTSTLTGEMLYEEQ